MIEKGKHFITCDGYTKDTFDLLMTDIFKSDIENPKKFEIGNKRKFVANLFYESSTRTNSSFYAAEKFLGFEVLNINGVVYSSVSKGETFEDTIRSIQTYADCIVLRHPETGAAKRASIISEVPIINAGDGIGEHPTQTVLDLYTIVKHFRKRKIEDLTITLVGDLKYGRTVHGLIKILHLYGCKINLVSPHQLKLPIELLRRDDNQFLNVTDEILKETDVLYLTRVQKERGAIISAGSYSLKEEHAKILNPNAIVMHPLPRMEELPTWFDNDPRAKYFEQMKNGLITRKYILKKILS